MKSRSLSGHNDNRDCIEAQGLVIRLFGDIDELMSAVISIPTLVGREISFSILNFQLRPTWRASLSRSLFGYGTSRSSACYLLLQSSCSKLPKLFNLLR